MRSRALIYTLTVLLVATAAAGCFDTGPPAPDRVQDWRDERDAHRPFGQAPATVDVTGPRVVVTGSLQAATLRDPSRLGPGLTFPSDQPLLYVDGTTLGDGRTGLVVVKGDEIAVQGGRLTDVPVDKITAHDHVRLMTPVDGGIGSPEADRVPGWEAANESLDDVQEWGPTPEDLEIRDASRAVLVQDGRSRTLDLPVTIDGGEIYASGAVGVTVEQATTSADRFRIAGNVTGGQARVDGGASAQAPAVVTGSADRVTATPGRVATNGTARVTQIVDRHGEPLVDAEVELFAPDRSVEVEEGDSPWVTVWYRERSYQGDALVEDVDVSGLPDGSVEIPTERSDLLDSPAVQLALLVPGAQIAVPFLAFLDMFSDPPEPLKPWIDAGEVGFFHVIVKGNLEPGTYDLDVTLSGNFPDASTSVDVEVHSADAGE